MEKFSRWRVRIPPPRRHHGLAPLTLPSQDPGTGIQPFLPPVPATSDSPFLVVYRAVAGIASISRGAVLALVALVYLVLVDIPERVLVSMVKGVGGG